MVLNSSGVPAPHKSLNRRSPAAISALMEAQQRKPLFGLGGEKVMQQSLTRNSLKVKKFMKSATISSRGVHRSRPCGPTSVDVLLNLWTPCKSREGKKLASDVVDISLYLIWLCNLKGVCLMHVPFLPLIFFSRMLLAAKWELWKVPCWKSLGGTKRLRQKATSLHRPKDWLS